MIMKKVIYTPVYVIMIALITSSCAAKKELAALRVEHVELENELATERLENQELSEKTADLKDESYRLEQRLKSAKYSLQQVSQQDAACPEAMKDGVVFKVQLGAFEKIDLPDELDASVNMGIERDGDLNQYVIGQFRSYEKADRLKTELRNMGVEKAWIVPYRNGNRVPLEDVVDTIK